MENRQRTTDNRAMKTEALDLADFILEHDLQAEIVAELVRRGEVTVEHAYEYSMDPKTFEHYL